VAESLSKLEIVLWDLLKGYLEEDETELSIEVANDLRRRIREWLEVSDSPDGRDPYEFAHWICWNCETTVAAERWLRSMTKEEIAELQLGDVLMALAPGVYNDIEGLAKENEEERNHE
jgi:hypothetical protein